LSPRYVSSETSKSLKATGRDLWGSWGKKKTKKKKQKNSAINIKNLLPYFVSPNPKGSKISD